MPFRYLSSPAEATLSQGEIICNILEVPPTPSDIKQLYDETKAPHVIRRTHPMAVIISQDCDLDWDWKARALPEQVKKDELDENKLLTHVQFCELFKKEDIRWSRGFNSKLWERVTSGQDERYHQFNPAPIGDSERGGLPNLYADFKRIFSLPVDYAYWLISCDFAIRKALIPEPYLRDFIQRLFSYLSRVAIPDETR